VGQDGIYKCKKRREFVYEIVKIISPHFLSSQNFFWNGVEEKISGIQFISSYYNCTKHIAY